MAVERASGAYVAHGSDYVTPPAPSLQQSATVPSIYANVSLDQTGTRTVQFSTTNWTKAQQYTIRVEQNFGIRNQLQER